ncbi:MAG: hypothetical protein ACRDJX_00890 [Solirubrobacteraceae bacterium]
MSARGARVPAGWLGLVAFTSVLTAIWLVVQPRTPDLAAQLYRVSLFRTQGFVVWDDNWYAGHYIPGYSLLYPPLASLVGLRLLGALCVMASTLLFWRAADAVYGRRAGWAGLWFAVAALGEVWSGQMTFALGVPLALAAGLALIRERWLAAGALAALCAAASPVAGALLGLAGLTVTLSRRSPRALLTLAGPAVVVVLAGVALFPEGGYEPYPFWSFAATIVVVLAFLWALPSRERLLRIGGCVYLLACVGCAAVHSPIGSNVERYGVLLAGPLMLCALLSGGDARTDGVSTGRSRTGVLGRIGPVGALALCLAAGWVLWGPIRETRAVAGSEATSASYYAPVKRFLAQQHGGPVRVEVPLTRSHWEAALLAPSVALARGWEKQMETRYDDVLLAGALTAASYERWLHQQAVSYVALPDLPLDSSSKQEGRLIRGGLPYLREVFATTHWRIYRVLGATPLASGPGTLEALGHDSFSLSARRAGSFVVRVRYTPYWTLTRGSGCVARASGGWTVVSVRAPGEAVVRARFSLSRAFSSGASCSPGA